MSKAPSKMKRGIIAGLMGAMLAVAGCSNTDTTPTSPGPDGSSDSATELTTVKIGITPYFEYQPWRIAAELGLDEEQGLNFEFISYDSTNAGIVGAYRGDVQLTSTCHACTMPLLNEVPNITDWITTNQFKGFILVGRKGEVKTYDDLVGELGPEKAKEEVLNDIKGRSFAIHRVSYEALLTSALEQVGLTLDDVTIYDFADDSKAALAFMSGTGDYYIGGLPQEAKLLEDAEKYVNVGGTEVLGEAGLWYSSMVSTREWLDANPELAQKLLAVWYRVMEYMDQKPEVTDPIFTKLINEATAADLPVSQVGYIVTELDFFATLDEALDNFYNPDSDIYFRKSIDYLVAGNADVLPEGYDPHTQIISDQMAAELAKNEALVEWIKSPLK